jgi:hypothetical protein
MKNNMANSIRRIGIVYHFEFDEERISLFLYFLRQYQENIVRYVIERWISTEKEPPTIADLIRNCEVISDWAQFNQGE